MVPQGLKLASPTEFLVRKEHSVTLGLQIPLLIPFGIFLDLRQRKIAIPRDLGRDKIITMPDNSWVVEGGIFW